MKMLAKLEEDIELRLFIAGARIIRLASQSNGDKLSEAQLYALELAAYQRLLATPTITKLFASVYGVLSNYGCSLWKPAIWLLTAWFFLGLLYALLNESAQSSPFLGGPDFGELSQGLLYSLSRVIPLGPWQDLSFAESILTTSKVQNPTYSTWQKILVVLLAALQSLFSGILLFLFGLAARRKFQVG
jgi:hypothetical protein